MPALSKDHAKEIQPFIARAVPLMLERDADHLSLDGGQAVYEAAWYRAGEREFSLHLTVRVDGAAREDDSTLTVADDADVRKVLGDELLARLGALRAA